MPSGSVFFLFFSLNSALPIPHYAYWWLVDFVLLEPLSCSSMRFFGIRKHSAQNILMLDFKTTVAKSSIHNEYGEAHIV
jgi:hypothetical protein